MDEEGCVFIKWVDRTVSKVKPQELYKVDTEVRSLFELRSYDLFIRIPKKAGLGFSDQTGRLNGRKSFSSVLETFSKSS